MALSVTSVAHYLQKKKKPATAGLVEVELVGVTAALSPGSGPH
jgi:hypothetical protein